jgi:hypothetical protein
MIAEDVGPDAGGYSPEERALRVEPDEPNAAGLEDLDR